MARGHHRFAPFDLAEAANVHRLPRRLHPSASGRLDQPLDRQDLALVSGLQSCPALVVHRLLPPRDEGDDAGPGITLEDVAGDDSHHDPRGRKPGQDRNPK